jgi:hypothetical protein
VRQKEDGHIGGLLSPVLSMEGLIKCEMYCEVSSTVNVASAWANKEAIEDRGVLSWGNRREDHDHPIPW